MGDSYKMEPKEKAAFAISITFSVVAIIVSIYATIQSKRYHSDSTSAQLLNDSYQSFHELARYFVESPLHTSLLVTPDKYEKVKSEVSVSIKQTPQSKLAELILQERGIALLVFQNFEKTYYQYIQATEYKDVNRSAFLKEVLNYYTQRLLRNPRLLYYWNSKGDNLQVYFEQPVRNYYQKHVSFNKENIDFRGVFLLHE